MKQSRRIWAATAALSALITGAGTFALTATAHAATLCNSQTAPAAGGTYTIQNNEWGSGAAECITTDGNADFTVANSAISNATNGAPGGYIQKSWYLIDVEAGFELWQGGAGLATNSFTLNGAWPRPGERPAPWPLTRDSRGPACPATCR